MCIFSIVLQDFEGDRFIDNKDAQHDDYGLNFWSYGISGVSTSDSALHIADTAKSRGSIINCSLGIQIWQRGADDTVPDHFHTYDNYIEKLFQWIVGWMKRIDKDSIK